MKDISLILVSNVLMLSIVEGFTVLLCWYIEHKILYTAIKFCYVAKEHMQTRMQASCHVLVKETHLEQQQC